MRPRTRRALGSLQLPTPLPLLQQPHQARRERGRRLPPIQLTQASWSSRQLLSWRRARLAIANKSSRSVCPPDRTILPWHCRIARYDRISLTCPASEREVKKATRELASSLAGCDSAIARIDYVQKRYAALVGEMKKLEREHRAAKRKADLMQKERDTAKTELTKMTSVKDKLEKLSRETTNENRKLRVRSPSRDASDWSHKPYRRKSNNVKTRTPKSGTN
jgi:hypothetical protein